jgi:hypothetical protein
MSAQTIETPATTIRRRRLALGLTETALARAIGQTNRAGPLIGLIEQSRAQVPLDWCIPLAKVLEIDTLQFALVVLEAQHQDLGRLLAGAAHRERSAA